MRKFRFLILLSLCYLPIILAAQGVGQAESRYKSALADYRQAKYGSAMEKLAPLTAAGEKTAFTAYAHYYYALSAFQLKKYRESRQMLQQLLSRYPGWNRINDAYYLLAANAMETSQPREGLDYLAKIKESSFSKDIQSLKLHGLAGSDLATLITLQKAFPQDREVALALFNHIGTSPSSSATDYQLAAGLDKEFKFSKKEKSTTEKDSPKRSEPKSDGQWTKGYFDVAVLLPFRLEEAAGSKRRSNQFAYDYYLGLKLAREQLLKEGITVNLWAYDIGNDDKPMKAVSENKNFRQSDLVIGPLYPTTFDVAASYISGASSVMINPLSTDGNLLKAADNIYLAHPSVAFQTKKAAEWMKSQAPGANAVIYYGNTSKDSAMAFSYAESWKSLGGKAFEIVKIIPDREWLESKITATEQSKPGHVALFSSDGASGSMVIEILNGRKLQSLPVVATSASFNMQQSRMSRYGARLFLIEPDYVDRDKQAIREFQRIYWDQNSTFPSVYSYQGYDQLLFFARMLNEYKDKLPSGLQRKKVDGNEYLLSGFDFTKARENQITPVLKYSGSRWIPIDR